MSNKKISGLPVSGALTGTEKVEIVQDGVSMRTTTQDIADLGASGGGSGDPFDTDVLFFDQQDFVLGTATLSGWSSSGSGAGQAFGLTSPGYGINATENAVGVASQTTGTATSGRNHIFKAEVMLATHEIRFRIRAALETLSDGTETYTIRFGLSDLSNITGDPDDAIFFRYTHSVNGGEYQAVTRDGTVETATDTNVAATTTYKVFEILVNQAGTSVDFIIDGVTVATIATNLPTGEVLNFWSQITKSAGTTTRNWHIDWTEITLSRTTAR